MFVGYLKAEIELEVADLHVCCPIVKAEAVEETALRAKI